MAICGLQDGKTWFSYNPFYKEHLANFIRDLRGEFNTPKLPFVIGQMGVSGTSDPGTNESNFQAAQAAVGQLPEFRGNVKVVATPSGTRGPRAIQEGMEAT